MSLLFVIDGYNILNHPGFNRKRNATSVSPAQAIQFLIREKRLTGSLKNKVILVFDGYPAQGEPAGGYSGINLIYSRKVSADEIIKQIVEESTNRGNIVVVSDDKEIKLTARFLRARHMGVEEFIGAKEKAPRREEPLSKPELNYSQAHKINEELKKLWL